MSIELNQDKLLPRKTPSQGSMRPKLSPKPALSKNRNVTAGGSLASKEFNNINRRPKKQPSEILNLFTAIKMTPTLDEKRAIEEKERLADEEQDVHEQKLRHAAKKLQVQIQEIAKAAQKLEQQQIERTQKINKVNFKSLKQADGSVYFGMTMQCLPLA